MLREGEARRDRKQTLTRVTLASVAALLAVGCAAGPRGDVNPGTLPLATLPAAETWEAVEGGAERQDAVEPEVINRAEVSRAIVRHYDPALRRQGVGGTAEVQMYVDAEGWVRHVRLRRGSGHAGLDRAALEVALVFRFSPARVSETPVPVWLTVPISFRSVH
jgi:TonB family protein